MRLVRFTLEDHAYGASRLPKTTVLQSSKNSVEIHGIPVDIGISTDEVVCKVAAAFGVQIAQDNIEISHRLYRKKGTKPIIAKFLNHKDTRQSYIKQEFNSGM